MEKLYNLHLSLLGLKQCKIVPDLWEYQLRDRGKSPDNPYDTYGFDLVVSLNWDADDEYLCRLNKGLRNASSFLFEATDGYFLIRSVIIFENNVSWSSADVHIVKNRKDIPITHFRWQWVDQGIWIGDQWPIGLVPPRYPDYGRWYRTLVHELCHWEFNFFDEYCPPGSLIIPYTEGPPFPYDEQLPTIMANEAINTELSTKYLYDNPPPGKNTNTAQHYWRGRSCWEDIFVWFNYFSGLSVARREVRHGVQFDLDHNGIIDDSYYANYQPDTFGEWSSHENPIIKYPVGNFLNIYLSGNPDE